MLNRRTVMTAAAATAATAAVSKANAAAPNNVASQPVTEAVHYTPHQEKVLNIRFDTLDGESHQDFVVGLKAFLGGRGAAPDTAKDVQAIMRSKGLTAIDDTDKTYEQCFNIFMESPAFAARTRLDTAGQSIMWDRARRAFARRADYYLGLLDDAETKGGPGRLEMNPNLVYPDYACHEIHSQPGGFVGDPLGGWVYHYAVTLGYRMRGEAQRQRTVGNYERPADGQVRRCVDLGCGVGLSTHPLKVRFPKAEVWGVEVSGPIVRYAHYLANKMELDVNFRHALAEDTRFPENYFDIASSSLMFHEVSADASKKIAAELFRVLRPGGLYIHNDPPTEGNPNRTPARTISGKMSIWKTHVTNSERWFKEYTNSDFPGILRSAGFQVDLSGPGRGNIPRVIATKPA